MTYRLGKHSLSELEGVHPNMVEVVERAIHITKIDFTVFDGLRTDEEQREYVRTGVSQTLRSRHLKQKDGFGHAVDLVPYINRKLRWELSPCIIIARAVALAAQHVNVGIIWGGGWDRLGREDPSNMVEAYIERKRLIGEMPFIDAPHYQLA